ncbi:MAG TPA: hypothetical protein VH598_16330 [Verrucomicrobiae bacterium]|jgi:hypothetical protein|nr:hypothetical protein [Verrucomicrobiae bacterium]
MPPDANWPAIPNYREFTAADHAAHTSPKGIPYPETLMGTESVKATKGLMKLARKPHLKLNTKGVSTRGVSTRASRHKGRRKKKT